MKVILLKKITGKDKVGTVTWVSDGYARNCLIPRGIAIRATPEAERDVANRLADIEKAQAEKLAQAQSLAEKLSGQQLKIVQKAGIDGRLFGSVGNADILKALHKSGFDTIEKMQIQLSSGPFKAIGEYAVKIDLYPEVVAEVGVIVEGDMR